MSKTLADIEKVHTRYNGSVLVSFKDGTQRFFLTTARMMEVLGGAR